MIRHAAEDPRFRDHPGLERYGIQSYIAVPLFRAGGELFGTLCALDSEPAPALDDDALDVLRLLADMVSHELESVEAHQERERFIDVLGHDLRNPLNAVCLSAQVLLAQDLPADQVSMVRAIIRSSERITHLVDDLTDVTRGRLGQGLEIQPVPLDVQALLGTIADELRSAYPHAEIHLRSPGPVEATWDAARCGQIFSNLLANAVQHGSAEAPIEIRVEPAPDAVAVSLHNPGPAIPAEVLPRIFEPFKRGVGEHGGQGLGLYIAAEMTRAHGGTISVRSREGEGTTFTVVMPRSLEAAAGDTAEA